jgi:hypothetical protein
VKIALPRLVPLLLLVMLLGGCKSMAGLGRILGTLGEFALYLAGIALPFVLAYYLSKD